MHRTSSYVYPLLQAIEAELLANPFTRSVVYAPTAEPWQRAGIFLSDDASALCVSPAALRGDFGVFTRHARQLSWLFFNLLTDSRLYEGPWGEHAFFGRLADAANAFLAANQPETGDWSPLLQAVLHEADTIVRERRAVAAKCIRIRQHKNINPQHTPVLAAA